MVPEVLQSAFPLLHWVLTRPLLWPATLTWFYIPFHKSLLGSRSLISTSAMLYPLFSPVYEEQNKNNILFPSGWLLWSGKQSYLGHVRRAWFNKVPVHRSSHGQKWQRFLAWKIMSQAALKCKGLSAKALSGSFLWLCILLVSAPEIYVVSDLWV